jgi:cytochrome c biogenesis protein CcdA
MDNASIGRRSAIAKQIGYSGRDTTATGSQMIDLLAVLLPILLVDMVNPVLFAMLVLAAGSGRPVSNSAAMLAGHTLAYFGAGILVSFGIEKVAARLANPEPVDFIISGLVGTGLLWTTLATKKNGAPSADEPQWELTPMRCLGFGAVVNFVGIPFALPYFAVIDQIMKAGLSVYESIGTLAAYNAAYALPFTVVPAAAAISGERAKPMLEKVNSFIAGAADIVMPWMLGLLGLALVADAIAFFYRGEGLWQF